jgi:hypothetical protein
MRSDDAIRSFAAGRSPARTGLGCALLAAFLAEAAPCFAQLGPTPEPLNLFQMIARSDLVALVKVRDGSLKYAMVDLVEALKGTPPGPRLRIAFRDFNFTRGANEEMIVFPSGQQEILFLVPFRTPRRKKDIEKFKDLFTLYKGRQGRITLPAEGPGIVLEAIRSLSEISSLDAARQVEAFRGLLNSSNPFLLEASLAEIERLRVADTSLLTKLITFLVSPSADLKTRSLRVIAQVFGSEGASGDSALDEARAALAAVLERAHNDSAESVRVQAVAAMAAWPRRVDVEGDLRSIAGTDRAQAVRYEAERALLGR